MSDRASATTVDVLVGSPRKDFWEGIQSILQGYYPYKMRWVQSPSDILDTQDGTFKPILALIDGSDSTGAANEWAQATKMNYSECAVLVLHSAFTGIDFDQVKKNGANEIMHLFYDREFVSDMVLQMAPIDLEGDHIPITALMPVDLRDLEIDSEINFDIFVHLNANQKTVLYRKAGAQIEGKSLDKFSSLKQNMYIKKTQMKYFFEYARTVLSARNVSVPISMTEKFQKSKKSIFNIMSNFMNSAPGDFEEGRKILAECHSIIEQFDLTKDQSPQEIFAEITRFSGNTRSNYHDAINVAAYASFFAQLLEFPAEKRQDAALAGLLHNIGLSQLMQSAAVKEVAKMNAEEIEDYRRYPDRSVNMVKAKKVALKPEVSVAISQHRELGNGEGFPKALKNDELDDLSKLLILAYNFHTLTCLENKVIANSPKTAIEIIKKDVLKGASRFDLIFANKLAKIISAL